ncbi:MAG: hypothetical protein AAF417_19580 [Pseudomonadota bacterium]
MKPEPLIVYIPGLLPKPEPHLHREQLLRCLLAGVRKSDTSVADDIEACPRCFDLVSWTYDFYREHRDIDQDLADIEQLLSRDRASERDIEEAVSWGRRFALALYRVGDYMPFLIPRLANEKLEVHLRDLLRYNRNVNDIAEHTRRQLKRPLEAAASAQRPILLIAHSMGSVISFDALWQLTHVDRRPVTIDAWLTLGSPLGQNYLQKRLLGCDRSGAERYPDNVRRWLNVAAYGDMTAVDRRFENDFAEMARLSLLEEIVDYPVFNHYRFQGRLDAHAEYGYLVNETTAGLVCEWWREQRAP